MRLTDYLRSVGIIRYSDRDPSTASRIAFNRVVREIGRLEDALNDQAEARARKAAARRETERLARKARRKGA